MSIQSLSEYAWLTGAGVTVASNKLPLMATYDQSTAYAVITLVGFGILIIGGRFVDLVTKYRKANSGTAQGQLEECKTATLLLRVHYETIITLKDDEYRMVKAANAQLHTTNATLHSIIIDQAKTMAELQGLKATKSEILTEQIALGNEILRDDEAEPVT